MCFRILARLFLNCSAKVRIIFELCKYFANYFRKKCKYFSTITSRVTKRNFSALKITFCGQRSATSSAIDEKLTPHTAHRNFCILHTAPTSCFKLLYIIYIIIYIIYNNYIIYFSVGTSHPTTPKVAACGVRCRLFLDNKFAG